MQIIITSCTYEMKNVAGMRETTVITIHDIPQRQAIVAMQVCENSVKIAYDTATVSETNVCSLQYNNDNVP